MSGVVKWLVSSLQAIKALGWSAYEAMATTGSPMLAVFSGTAITSLLQAFIG